MVNKATEHVLDDSIYNQRNAMLNETTEHAPDTGVIKGVLLNEIAEQHLFSKLPWL